MWSSVALIVVATTATVRFATAFSSSSSSSVAPPAPMFFSSSSSRDRATSLFAAIDGDNEENDDETKRKNGVEWLREAMGEDAVVAATAATVPARTGLAGFAVDREMGFVAVLGFSSNDDDDDDDAVRYACAVVNREDTSFLRSPEALTLVQLAGGMDLGTAVLPPDALARVVADDNDDDDDNESSIERGRVELVGVTAVLCGPEGSAVASDDETDDDDDDEEVVASTPEREAAVVASVAAVTAAVRRLPGLGAVREEDVAAAARRHADAEGRLNREAFSRLLGTLRDAADRTDEEEVGNVASFTLTVSVDGGALRSVRGVDRFRALALSLRHGVVVDVDAPSSSSFDAPDATALATRLPFFRPIRELEEDAKVMDGFIPSMFFQEKPPGIDDRV